MAMKNQTLILFVTIFVATIFGLCSAATITVGGKTGWTIPPSTSFYSNWSSSQTFRAGDTLVFNFPGPVPHTVAEVNKKNFDACNTANSNIGAVHTTSPTSITLTTAGTHYYICPIPGHCSGGQKLSVVVTGSSSTASPASSPTPSGGPASPATSPAAPTGGATSPSGSTTSPSGSPTTTVAEAPTTPPPSLATSINVGVSVMTLVCVAIAFFML